MTPRITLHIFRMTYALFIDAVPLPMAAYKPLLISRRYHWGWTNEIVNLKAHHVPWWSCCQQLWIHCEHTAAQVGLPWCPTDKAQKRWHRQLLGYFWGLDILDQGQALWPQRLSQYQLLELLSWREKPFFELVVPDQILHLLTQCWFDSSSHGGCKWLSVRNRHCLHCNFHK